ncbi:hypothetical protein NL676_038584 [Syzygium grande]|nr:hypothetical protein NL676_038584 [Syzygium grande]
MPSRQGHHSSHCPPLGQSFSFIPTVPVPLPPTSPFGLTQPPATPPCRPRLPPTHHHNPSFPSYQSLPPLMPPSLVAVLPNTPTSSHAS